jgi:23S rRNA (adenine2503-C2)-methyltransferase
MQRAARNLYGLDPSGLADLVSDLGAKPYAAGQLSRWLYRHGAGSFAEMTDVAASLREGLERAFSIEHPRIVSRFPSLDGTVRYLLELPAGGRVEAVAILDRGRTTFCISSQVGCALGCTFCMTGTLGLVRHLPSGDIVGQVRELMQDRGLSPNHFNLVFMGMGEPLHNYDNVTAALRILTSSDAFAIGARRITVSTAGMAPEIERLAREPVHPRLAVSLSATTDETRSRLIPINRRYPIARLREACRVWLNETGEKVFLEYVMLAGENDTPEDAARLVRLARGIAERINLIPFNETPLLPHRATPFAAVMRFREEIARHGIRASVRRSRGRDIGGACGMLALGSTGAGHRTHAAETERSAGRMP